MKVSVKKYAEALALSLKKDEDKDSHKDKMKSFLSILRKNKKLKVLKRFMPAFRTEWYKISGKIEVKVTVPHKLDEKEREELAHLLKQAFGKEVILEVHTDPEILGGLKMDVGEYVIDGTLIKNLQMLKTKIVNN
ncbi:MAG: F0F1 ATP synthase subunit delta [Candidatus Gracilibacteria bacterium]|jgi:F-type H+-transporting ATPase subunit delta